MDASDLEELSTVEYWDQRYTKQTPISGDNKGIAAHEWFRSFDQLRAFLARRMETLAKDAFLLHLGCGDSTLPAGLYALGFTNQICLDFSHVVIQQMTERYQDMSIRWIIMDVREISLPDCHIDLAIDKGTFDAFLHGSMWDPPDDVRINVGRYVDGVLRVLKHGARWIYITYRQPHFIKPLLLREKWDIEVESLNDDAGGFEYFAFIMTKHAV